MYYNHRYPLSITTRSGRYVDLATPDTRSIDAGDIIYALCHIGRFVGHTDHFYSVGQHTLALYHTVPQYLKKAALLHDASEAYLGDISKPLKSMLLEYQMIEKRFTEQIFIKYGLDLSYIDKIKPYDKALNEYEYSHFFEGIKRSWIEYQAPANVIKSLTRAFEFSHVLTPENSENL